MLIDPADLDRRQLYRLMISIIVPRPIAWVSTQAADGTLNAAPFSYFQALSSQPPMVMVAVGKRRGGAFKDTRSNIEATGEFVVNVVGAESARRMVRTSVDHPPEVSEFEEAGLTPVASTKVDAPRIEECAVSLECKLDRVLEVGTSGVLIGEVVAFHLREDVVAGDGTVDPWRLRPLGRLGGSNYAPLREVLHIDQQGDAHTVHGELLDLWRDQRRRSVAIANALKPEHLARRAGDRGDPVGRILRHIAGCTTWMRLKLAGREEEDELRAWDESWTPERLAGELERDGGEFEVAVRVFLPEARELLRTAIRHEAWHQGQIAAALRDVCESHELWNL
jgi:flavin reductase (DIM6/NTAB) family NADH-FMN oxidoreductase RutF